MQLPKRYTITELAQLLKVSKTTLIYWASQGYIPKPKRKETVGRGRYWTEEDAQLVADYRAEHYSRI